jgi:hypothetical protein
MYSTSPLQEQVVAEHTNQHKIRSSSPSRNAKTKTFKLKDGVGLYGGFVGTEEQLLSERNILNETILSE